MKVGTDQINVSRGVWMSSRNWLAVALLQEVRLEARCNLCALIRFIWPRAQQIVSYRALGVPVRLATMKRVSVP
ncbi:hypothetical protein FHW79_006362 [Azospirillum sp. OGB3]|nr:hypothetical protein [Azospirillum sp. OGB3]